MAKKEVIEVNNIDKEAIERINRLVVAYACYIYAQSRKAFAGL